MGETLSTETVSETYSPRKKAKQSKGSQPIELSEEARIAKDDVISSLAEEKLNLKAQKKKLRASRRVQPVEVAPSIPEEPVKKSKKRKHRAEDVVEGQDNDSSDPKEDAPPPKKKHKNRTEFTDPREDAALSNQSRKALEYVFTQMNRPSKWKFNKARQNWLIRNVWAPESISDIYFPLVLKYIASVQGGSREKLIEACRSYLVTQEVENTLEKETSSVQPQTSESALKPTPSITKPKPGPLVNIVEAPKSILKSTNAKPTPGPLIDASSITSAMAVIPAVDANVKLSDIRRSRAEALLKTLQPEAISDRMEA